MLKVRCSSLGAIMTNPRSKKETLGQTTKSFVKQYIIERKFGIYKEIHSKYFDKGNEVEADAISLCNDVMNLGFIYKNDEKFKNDYITGIPDVNTNDVLLDIKSSWDLFTFPFFDTEIKNKGYYYQLQGYMWLTGKTEAYLCYCLMNTPQHLVEDEVRREHWRLNAIDELPEVRKHIESNHNFDHIDDNLRIKSYHIKYDPELIEEFKRRIEACREYYNELDELLTIKEIQDAK